MGRRCKTSALAGAGVPSGCGKTWNKNFDKTTNHHLVRNHNYCMMRVNVPPCSDSVRLRPRYAWAVYQQHHGAIPAGAGHGSVNRIWRRAGDTQHLYGRVCRGSAFCWPDVRPVWPQGGLHDVAGIVHRRVGSVCFCAGSVRPTWFRHSARVRRCRSAARQFRVG